MITERMVLDKIREIAKQTPFVFTERIAQELNTSKANVIAHYTSLRDSGFIVIQSVDAEVIKLAF